MSLLFLFHRLCHYIILVSHNDKFFHDTMPVIPGGVTSVLQPLDDYVNKPLKENA